MAILVGESVSASTWEGLEAFLADVRDAQAQLTIFDVLDEP